MFSALVCGVLEGGTSIRGYVCFDVDGISPLVPSSDRYAGGVNSGKE